MNEVTMELAVTKRNEIISWMNSQNANALCEWWGKQVGRIIKTSKTNLIKTVSVFMERLADMYYQNKMWEIK